MKWVFWLAVGLIAYTYAGYPAWLWLRGRLRPRPIRRGAIQPRISLVMVVRNEARVLRSKLENLLALDYPQDLTEVVVVSDGSTDGSEEILHQFARNPRVHVVLNQLSQGKASALNDALAWAQSEIVIFTDARQKIETGAVRALLENFADPDVGCVSGELMLGDPDAGEHGQGMGLYWRIEKKVRELESCSGSVVGATGALYGARRDLLVQLPPDTLLDDVYIPMQVVHAGKRVVFETRARAWDLADQGATREFARKVRTLSGNYQLLELAPWLLDGSNPIRLEFVSHKLLRLVVPFALLACLASSALLAGPFYGVVLAAQIAFYALSLVGLAPVKTGVFSRLGDAAYTFVVLNTAAVVAFAHFVSGRRTAWTR